MKEQGIKTVLNMLAVNYPATYKNMSQHDLDLTYNLWMDRFKDVPEPVMIQALGNYIDSNEYPPTIAGLKKEIAHLMPQDESTAALWNEARKALGKASVFSREDFERLSPALQQWLGGVSGVQQYRYLQITDLPYLQSYFAKTIEEEKQRATAQRLMPPEIRALLKPQEKINE